MLSQSPALKLTSMAPLSLHYKQIEEEEPFDLEIEKFRQRISFNEKLIVCTYKPGQTVSSMRKTVEKIKGITDSSWVNPTLQEKERKISRSILKQPCTTELSLSTHF